MQHGNTRQGAYPAGSLSSPTFDLRPSHVARVEDGVTQMPRMPIAILTHPSGPTCASDTPANSVALGLSGRYSKPSVATTIGLKSSCKLQYVRCRVSRCLDTSFSSSVHLWAGAAVPYLLRHAAHGSTGWQPTSMAQNEACSLKLCGIMGGGKARRRGSGRQSVGRRALADCTSSAARISGCRNSSAMTACPVS